MEAPGVTGVVVDGLSCGSKDNECSLIVLGFELVVLVLECVCGEELRGGNCCSHKGMRCLQITYQNRM